MRIKGQKGIDGAYAICNSSIEETMMKDVLETKLKGCGCQKNKKTS